MTHYAILPEEQRAMLPALTPAREIGLTLYGGTAAALQLGHRQSVDFDFFTAKPLDEVELVAAMPFLNEARLVQQGPDTLTVAFSPLGAGKPDVKLSFFGNLNFGRVGQPKLTKNGELLVASRLDLLGHKLKVLLQRVEAKDYRDIAALLRSGMRLEAGLGAAQALFRSMFPPDDAARALTYFGDGDLGTVPDRDKELLRNAVAQRGPTKAVPVLSRDLTTPDPETLPDPSDARRSPAKVLRRGRGGPGPHRLKSNGSNRTASGRNVTVRSGRGSD